MTRDILINDLFEEITQDWRFENKVLFLLLGTEKLFQEKRFSEDQIKQLKKIHKKYSKIYREILR